MSNFFPQEIIDDVNSRLDIRLLMQSIDYRFEKYQENPKTAKGFCPIHREGLFRNLVIDRETRSFRCQYTQCTGSQGGNLVSLFAQARSVDVDSAIRAIVHDQSLPVELPVNHELVKAELAVADQDLASKAFDDAEARYRTILDIDPQCSDAHHGLLKIFEGRGETEARAEKLVTVCRLKIAEGRAAEVPDLIQEWTELDPDSPEARFACAELLYANGDAESAVMEFMGGGDACEGANDLEAALHAYQRAATISRENHIDVIDVTPHIVRVLTQADRSDDAVNLLQGLAEKAATEHNLDSAAEFCLMAIEVDPERTDSHRRFLETAAAIPPTPVISHQVIQSAQHLREHNEHEFAIHALEKFIVVAPEDEAALHALINEYNNHGRAKEALDLEAGLARLLYGQGRAEEAQEIIDRVLVWQPQHVPVLRTLIHIQEQENKGAESRETRRRLIRAQLAQKAYADALETADAMPAEDQNSEDGLDLRATALEGLALAGDTSAREAAVTALESIADHHLEATTGRRAISYLQRAAELLAEPPNSLLFKMARAHLRNKDYPQVRDTVITACENMAANDRLDDAILEAERYSNLIPQDTDLARDLVELYLRFDDKPAAVARLRQLAEELKRLNRGGEADEIIEQANDLEPQDLPALVRQLQNYREFGNTEKTQQALLRIAAFHEQQGQYGDATGILEEYLKESPNDSAAILRIINASDKQENYQPARQWRLHLARVYRGASDGDREARVLRDVLVRFTDDEEALHMLMNAEFNRGDMQAGVVAARRLASLQHKGGKSEAARKTMLKAVERVPENLDLNRDIYELHRVGRQPNQAITWGRKLVTILRAAAKNSDAALVFDQIVTLDPDNLALKKEQLQFLEEAGRDAEVAEKRLALADVYRLQERFLDAEAMLNEVLKIEPRNMNARRQLADLHLHLGENAKGEIQLLRIAGIHHLEGNSQAGIDLLQQVLAANPGNSDAHRQLAQIHRAEGNSAAAVEELLGLADAYRNQQMDVEAMAAEREALEIDPTRMDIGRRMADNLIAAGRSEQAADQLEIIAARHAELGHTEDALAVYDEILKMEPGRLPPRKRRAELLTALGQTDLAMKELQILVELAMNAPSTSATSDASPAQRPTLQLVPEYTFDQFVVGANNDFAHATALAIARSPARTYNPLFLYANVGLGKTHLCNAIANYLLGHDPKAQIIYTNSEDFTDELVEAIKNNNVQQFRTRYRSLDLFIIDDVQFLAGKERAQEEFFHIFNSLFQAKRQIVITSDRPPSEISHLESRLRSRFGAGVIVDIASPDLETRLAILNREVEENNLALEPWVSRLLSEKIDTNVRDLKGALNQVIAMRDLRKLPVTEESVNRMLETLYPTAAV